MNFIKEFQKLLLEKPRYNVKHVNAENCDYSDTAVNSKNCYYSFAVFYCEDVYYTRYSRKCNNCNGLTFCVDCEWCVECVDCIGCYSCDYCKNCQNCTNAQFSIDCFSCQDCIGCVGLYQKQYCVFNKQLTQEGYQKYMKDLDLQNLEHRKFILEQTKKVQKESVNLGIHKLQTEDCVGDSLTECKNCYQCYDAFKCEDCLYNIEANGNKDCCDITVCFEAENCYSCVQAPMNYDCNFLMHSDFCSDSEFCAYSKNLKDCFGCVYVENKQYCILNKQYTKERYDKKIIEIKKLLQNDKNYNMSLYFISEYEKSRLVNEDDSSIQNIIPN